MTAFKLLISGGGTGGHLFPAIAAAQELRRRAPDSEIFFLGAGRKIDTLGLASHGFAGAAIESFGFKGGNFTDKCKAMYAVPKAVRQALAHIRRFRPDVALGVGGYVTGPTLVAAKLLGVPTIIHEQNSVPGMANRLLGRIVTRICLSLPESADYFPEKKCLFTGNPLRESITLLAEEKSKSETAAAPSRPTLLVLGGSQGAHVLNQLVVEAFCGNRDGLSAIRLIHQTGGPDEATVRKRYAEAGIDAEVSAFFTDMAAVYRQADFCLSRAGATTLAELSALGLPAILVPFPFAADNHQERNANHYAQGGGAWVFKQDELTGPILARHILTLSGDAARLWAMARSMRGLARPDAAQAMVDVCLKTAGR
ncbi:MAG: undecaprenyldiphospho-muramoylpentapeptide beta-N-acetylglucosaminyltransferase [Desulfobulbaceae bacterium]|jgi:UDP-N-acetylglucosamine--N-acetylmuramyl-(pentapeptide) pyrophosphoryl-undecaprenol N-acetylglucosamine transferase|nr:undecaprenyldiphospho-muramoylpentapeptide beta-N-acetylglucosaminyltransferase [Desulfobulbaceae bacterium]